MKKQSPNYGFIALIMLALASIACAQDCIGVTFTISGTVQDEANNPIPDAIVHVSNVPIDGRSPLNLMLTTDNTGHFLAQDVFSYACEPLEFSLEHAGYDPLTTEFYPPSDEGWLPLLPDHMEIQLQSSS